MKHSVNHLQLPDLHPDALPMKDKRVHLLLKTVMGSELQVDFNYLVNENILVEQGTGIDASSSDYYVTALQFQSVDELVGYCEAYMMRHPDDMGWPIRLLARVGVPVHTIKAFAYAAFDRIGRSQAANILFDDIPEHLLQSLAVKIDENKPLCICYVGRTDRELSIRLAEHLVQFSGSRHKNATLLALRLNISSRRFIFPFLSISESARTPGHDPVAGGREVALIALFQGFSSNSAVGGTTRLYVPPSQLQEMVAKCIRDSEGGTPPCKAQASIERGEKLEGLFNDGADFVAKFFPSKRPMTSGGRQNAKDASGAGHKPHVIQDVHPAIDGSVPVQTIMKDVTKAEQQGKIGSFLTVTAGPAAQLARHNHWLIDAFFPPGQNIDPDAFQSIRGPYVDAHAFDNISHITPIDLPHLRRTVDLLRGVITVIWSSENCRMIKTGELQRVYDGIPEELLTLFKDGCSSDDLFSPLTD